jgi:5-methylcytosine-specific restriction protein A
MPLRPPLYRANGHQGVDEQRRHYDLRRGSSRERGYTSKWQKARAAYLAQHPLCVFCERERVLTPATVVDHIVAHCGDPEKFWEQSNWQSLCKRHHDSTKQREEKMLREGVVKSHQSRGRTGGAGKLLRPRNSAGGVT